MTERSLDRAVEFDERSRAFPARTLVAARAPRSFTWRCDVTLDQGREGACVGFGWAHEAAARPKPVRGLTAADALAVFRRSQELDQWAPAAHDGSSVLAGAKAGTERGWYGEYRWAFGEPDLALAVGWAGPAVLGLNWYEGMFEPGPDGFLRRAGALAGGHCLLCVGYSVRRAAYRLHNSWGPGWGEGGRAWLTAADMATLLAEDGEACVPVVRRVPT